MILAGAGAVLITLAPVATVQATAPALTVGFEAASAHVDRGETLNDSPVLQPFLEMTWGRFTLGVAGNLDLSGYNGEREAGRFSEIEFCAACALPFETFDLSLEYAECVFPGSAESAEREISLAAGLDLFLNPSLLIAYGVGGAIRDNLYLEAGVGHRVDLADNLGLLIEATLGYLDPDTGARGFSHYTASANLAMGPFYTGITWIGRINEDVLPDGPGAYDTKLVAALGISHEF